MSAVGSRAPLGLRVAVVGSGKVGRALAAAFRRAGHLVTLRSGRAKLPRHIDADVVVLAVRDGSIEPMATALRGVVSPDATCLHVAGALGPEALAPLAGACAGVGQMHPLASFASARHPPDLTGITAHVSGDRSACKVARGLARSIGMVPRTFVSLDLVGYHAAAALVANGAAALSAASAELLGVAGVPAAQRAALVGSLLGTVAANVAALGASRALTGPVRRGDVRAVARQRAVVTARAPHLLPLFDAVARAQVPLARALGDAAPTDLRALEALLAPESTSSPRRARKPARRR